MLSVLLKTSVNWMLFSSLQKNNFPQPPYTDNFTPRNAGRGAGIAECEKRRQMRNGPPATEVLSGKRNQILDNLLIVWLLNRRPSSFPESKKVYENLQYKWKMGDYGNGSLRLIFTALYISKGLLILCVAPAPLAAAELHPGLQYWTSFLPVHNRTGGPRKPQSQPCPSFILILAG